MQLCGGCARRHVSGFARRLLGDHAVPAPLPVSMSAPSVHEQRAHLERMLAATMIVLFLASVSYFALSTLYGCIRAWTGRRREPVGADGDSGAPAPSAVGGREETKRALEGITVQVVMVDEEEPDCAVCLEEYAAGDEVRVLPACRHGFHRECVDRWLLTLAPTCPVCRAPIGPVEGPDAKEDCATERADISSASFAGSRMLPAMWP